jgi:dTDP-4-amino-4,6-dideoxygalactose transaminase
LPTADSGMICFRDKEDDERVRKLTWLGINKDTFSRMSSNQSTYKWMYDVEEVGYKYHGNSIMAGIGLVQLKYLDQDNAYRRQLAARYRENFAGHAKVQVVEVAPGCESSTHLLQIRVANRDELMVKLNEHEIYPGVHYRDNTEYRMYAHGKGSCPRAELASNEIISLPLHLGLEKGDVDKVAQIALEFAQ